MKVFEKTRIFVLLTGFVAGLAHAELTTECQRESDGEESQWAYCVHRTIGSDSKDVLFYFHGVMGDEESWTDGANAEMRTAIRAHWEENHQAAPVVVSISLGGMWLFNEEKFDVFENQVMPLVEAKISDSTGRRMLMGVSMGGFNALRLLFRNPAAWDKVSIISPALPVCDPFMETRSLYFCIAADPYKNNAYAAYQSHMMVKKFFTDREQWEQNNPINILKGITDIAGFPRMLITAGTIDEFAFFSRAQDFAQLAKRKGLNLNWLPTELAHALYDPEEVAEFLVSE